MVADIWTLCQGTKHICFIHKTAWRIVEAQEMTATRKLVDSLEEQMILEDLIEAQKPSLPLEYLEYHPLLYTPFRYPPLKYGSRFGKKIEPALWYGSLELNTAFCEKAFYLFNFINASDAQFGIVSPQFTAFSVQVKSSKGIQLNSRAFSHYTSLISKPNSYQASQALGAAMREAEIKVFTYFSARDKNKGVNVGLFTPKAFLYKHPDEASFQSWQCFATKEMIEFSKISAMRVESKMYLVDQFKVGSVLPFPAG